MLATQTPKVFSVFGRTGAIVAESGDYASFYQPLDSDLTAYAELDTTGLVERTGSGTASTVSISSYVKTLLDDTNASDFCTTLGATTLGRNLFTLANPNTITFPRINADNTVSTLSASSFRTAISASINTHDHLDGITELGLTPINGFTAFGSPSYRNFLTVIPSIKLAILEFAVNRTTVPASDVTLMSWSSSYTATSGIKATPVIISMTGATSAPLAFAYVTGNELKWNLGSGFGGTDIAYMVGTITFTYQ